MPSIAFRCRSGCLHGLLALAVLVAPLPALAAPAALDLSRYTLTGRWALPAEAAAEASAVTYAADRGTLFVVGDEGRAIVEVTTSGAPVASMGLTGFGDTEGLAYLGGGQLVITEERLQDAFLIGFVANASVDRGSLPSVDLGPEAGNSGLEGISFDPRDGSFVTVKEKSLPAVRRSSIAFGTPGSAATSVLFNPATLGVEDLSDVQVLAGVARLDGTPAADHLLILSQASARLLEVDRAGTVLGSFDLTALSASAEGVTIDPATGTIYLVAEGGPTLFVLTAPVPLPPALPALVAALAALARTRRMPAAR